MIEKSTYDVIETLGSRSQGLVSLISLLTKHFSCLLDSSIHRAFTFEHILCLIKSSLYRAFTDIYFVWLFQANTYF